MWRGTLTLNPIPCLSSLLGGEDSIRRGCVLRKHSARHPWACARCDLLQNLQGPSRERRFPRGVRVEKNWQEMAQCLLPRQGLCPGSGFWKSELLVASQSAALWGVGRSGAARQCSPTDPAWGGKYLFSKFSTFFSHLLRYTVQNRILRSAPSSHDTSNTGEAREHVGAGKGNRTPLSFPLPRRASAQHLLLFLHGSLDQALLESFSESQKRRAPQDWDSVCAARGKPNLEGSGWTTQGAERS